MVDLCSRVASWLLEARVQDPAVLDKARVLLVDAVTLAISAHGSRSWTALQALGEPCTGSASLWADDRRVSAVDAAFRNSLLVHDRFQDDCELRSWTHPGSFVVPAAVAGAEVCGATFRSLLEAVAVGYAVVTWLGADEKVALALMRRGFRCSPVLAPFSAAAAFARAYGSSQEEAAAALSMTAVLGRGTLQSVGGGGDDWRWQNATATRDGVTMVLAASAGVRGAEASLEGPKGFLAAYCSLHEIPQAWQQLPRLDAIHGVWHKHYPTLGDNMAAAIAACLASPRLHGRGEVRAARLRMPAEFASFPGTQRMPPYATPTQALASVRFTVAAGLAFGRITLEHFEDYSNAALARLACCIDVQSDPDMPYTEVALDVETSDGSTVTIGPSDIPKGYFFRDAPMAIEAATSLIGPRGARVADALLGADDSADAAEVMARACLAAGTGA